MPRALGGTDKPVLSLRPKCVSFAAVVIAAALPAGTCQEIDRAAPMTGTEPPCADRRYHAPLVYPRSEGSGERQLASDLGG
jgi:hypothetical protein